MWLGGRRHGGQQEQQGGEDQGDRWHQDVLIQLKLSSTRMIYAVVLVVDIRVLYTFNKSDNNIKCMWIFGRWHCGRQEQVGAEAQEGRWHEDVSPSLEFSSTRMWYAEVMLVDIKVFINTFNKCENIRYKAPRLNISNDI